MPAPTMHTSVCTSLVSSANFGGSTSAQTDFVSASGRLTAVDIALSPNSDSERAYEEQILYRLPLRRRFARITAAHGSHSEQRPILNALVRHTYAMHSLSGRSCPACFSDSALLLVARRGGARMVAIETIRGS